MDSFNFNRFNKRRLYSTCRTPEFRHISIRHAPEPAHLPGSTRVRSGSLHFGEFRRSPPVRFRAVQRWAEELHRYVLLTTLPIKINANGCVAGQKFAMAEVKVVLSSILRRFKVALPSTRPLPIPSLELTLKSSTGFHLTVSRR